MHIVCIRLLIILYIHIHDTSIIQVSFASYLEMPEYNNIMTRMLAEDSFPYRNISIGEKVRGAV